jgi:gluconolactonase
VLGDPSVYAELAPDSSPDGMCFDALGRLIVTASTGGCLYVVSPGGGTIERVIESADPCPTNVCFGGPRHQTLLVTEGGHGRVVSLAWDTPGMVLFPDRGILRHGEG